MRTRVSEQQWPAAETVAEGLSRSAVRTRRAPRGCDAEALTRAAPRMNPENWALRVGSQTRKVTCRVTPSSEVSEDESQRQEAPGWCRGAGRRSSGAPPPLGCPFGVTTRFRKWTEAAAAHTVNAPQAAEEFT